MFNNNSKPRILIADDESSVTDLLCYILSENYDCTTVDSAEKALEKLRAQNFDLIVSDIKMRGMSGLEMIPQVKRLAPDTVTVILSGNQHIETAIEAMRVGAFDFITKPLDVEHVEAIIRRAAKYQALRVAKRRAETENYRLAAIVESSDDAITSKDFDGTILTWNKGAERLFGYSAAEAIGRSVYDIFPSECFDERTENEILAKIRRGEHVSNYETFREKKDGTRVPISLTVSAIKNGDGEVIGVSKIARDISERLETEKALRESEERYRAFIEQSSEGIWRFELTEPLPIELPIEEQMRLICRNTALAECNDAMAQQYGFASAQELNGKSIEEFLVGDHSINDEHLRDFIALGYKLIDTETLETDRHGKNKFFLSNLVGIVENGFLTRIWGMQRDITRTKQAEQAYQESEKQRRQSQKIDAVGRLAGGVAHDFNNFLAVIMLQVDMLFLQLPADSSARHRLGEIKSVTDNAAEMVRQLLAFSRQQPMQPRALVLNHVIGEFIKILRPLIGETIEVRLSLGADLGICYVDHNQITQILMNLVVNARDAMPGGGVINIATSNVVLNEREIKHPAQPVGAYIQMTVSDTGTGMDFKTQERIFEPFFTTKEIGAGTGLGLATVYGIVKQSNGFVWVESQVERGTTFTIHFPRADENPEVVEPETEALYIPRGSETILLVEDEEPVRRVAVEVLNALGYQVFEASNGMQAVQLAELLKMPIDLLITDVVMPRMNGKDLADKIKALHPEISVLLISGYTKDIVAHQGISEENFYFLEKPFSHQALAAKVREALQS